MVDVEPLRQHHLGVRQHLLNIVEQAAVDKVDVRGQGDGLGVDRPDVHVVCGADAGDLSERVGDRVGVESRGCGFQQHPDRVTQQPEDTEQHQHGDEDRDRWVSPGCIEEVDRGSRYHDTERTEGIRDEVPERCSHVEVRAACPAEHPRAAPVDGKSDHPDDGERRSVE